MTTLPKDFKEFIKLLNKNNVRYIIDLKSLIRTKQASGRTRDLADIEELT